MGGTTSGERIQLRGRPRAHRRPPVPIGDVHGLRLVCCDPFRGLKPQRVLPRAVRTRSSGRPGGSATAKGSARRDVVGKRMRRPGAERATTPPPEVRPPWPPSRRAQRPRRRRPGGRPGGSARGSARGSASRVGPGWIRGGKEEETRSGACHHTAVSVRPPLPSSRHAQGPRRRRPGGSATRVGHAGGPGWIRGGKEEETRRGARHHHAVSVRPPLPHSRHAQRPRRRRPGRGQPGGGATQGGQAGFVGERKRRPGAERASTGPW